MNFFSTYAFLMLQQSDGGPGVDIQTIIDASLNALSRWGLEVLAAIAILIIGRWVAKRAKNAVQKALKKGSMDDTLIPFVVSMVYWLIMAFVIIAVFDRFGVPVTSMIAVLGAAGLAIGLALQGTLSNFASGVMLLVFRPFNVGDFVDAGGTAGSVTAINMFNTTMNTPDNVRVIMPNSQVWGATIRNFGANPTRRVDMVAGISYDDDIQVAIDTINGILKADSRVLEDPAPIVAVNEMGDSSINILVRPWCAKEDYWALKWDVTRAMKEGLEAAGCSIPYPQRDVHLFQKS